MLRIDLRIGCSWRAWMLLLLAAAGLLGGCAGPNKLDPWEQSNRFFYNFNDGLDQVALKPLSDVYVAVLPQPVRTGLGNAFDNLGYGNVILNDILQGKWDQGGSDAARMAVNSIIGIGGIFDVAGTWGLAAHPNDFGITLGKWGVPAGPYVVLPLFGPNCTRDLPAIPVGMLTDPMTWVNPPLAVKISLGGTEAADGRSRAAKAARFRNEAAIDPYVFTREAYLQYRETRINEGKTPPKNDIYEEDEGPATRPAVPPPAKPAP
jgi:phospholipid-binding lipoprotein MlaA